MTPNGEGGWWCAQESFFVFRKKHRREVKMKERLKSVEIKKTPQMWFLVQQVIPPVFYLHSPANSHFASLPFSSLLIKIQRGISMFDKFINYAQALSWPFQACKINAYGRAPCLRCVIHPVC